MDNTDHAQEPLKVESLLWWLPRWGMCQEVKVHGVHAGIERVRGFCACQPRPKRHGGCLVCSPQKMES